MKKLLLISYVFPPAGGITVQRALSFAKYLPANGIEVHVLTARNAAAPVRDPGCRHIPPEVTVHRTLTAEPPFYLRKKVWDLVSGARQNGKAAPAAADRKAGPPGLQARLTAAVKRLLTPDPQVLWVPFAVRRASSLIRRHAIDCVMVTAPPFSVLLIGNALKRRFPGIKLITDFRDEWLRFYLTDFEFLKDDHTRRRAEQIERAAVAASDRVIAVTRSSLREIRGRYPEQPDAKFVFLPNGYDPDTFGEFTPRRHEGSGMVVTHMGTAYRTASPAYYLDALDAMEPEIRSRVETRFVGRVAETEMDLFRQSRLGREAARLQAAGGSRALYRGNGLPAADHDQRIQPARQVVRSIWPPASLSWPCRRRAARWSVSAGNWRRLVRGAYRPHGHPSHDPRGVRPGRFRAAPAGLRPAGHPTLRKTQAGCPAGGADQIALGREKISATVHA